MAIYAKIIQDSISYLNKRATTFILEFPRYILPELATHRVFSKNSASSRAIPFDKFVKMVEDNPVKPMWTANQKGMQGPVITNEAIISQLDNFWESAKGVSIQHAKWLDQCGVHKQNVNRLLEPWMHIKIILTATEFDNFFNLRNHPDAHPEIHELGKMMKLAMDNSTPTLLTPGQWHLPFGDNIDKEKLYEQIIVTPGKIDTSIADNLKLKISIARCARVSYNNFDGSDDYSKDIELYDRLVGTEPLHASPAEHQLRVPYPHELKELGSTWKYSDENGYKEVKGKYVSNISGYIQLRKLIETKEFNNKL